MSGSINMKSTEMRAAAQACTKAEQALDSLLTTLNGLEDVFNTNYADSNNEWSGIIEDTKNTVKLKKDSMGGVAEGAIAALTKAEAVHAAQAAAAKAAKESGEALNKAKS